MLDARGTVLGLSSMSTEAPPVPQKVNLRRPDIMAAVQAQVLSHYRSDLVERIRASGHILSAGDLTIKLAKEFGFCYGVERAIDLAYAARRAYPSGGFSCWARSFITRKSTTRFAAWASSPSRAIPGTRRSTSCGRRTS